MPSAAEMERYNTICNSPKQEILTAKPFKFIIDEVKHKLIL